MQRSDGGGVFDIVDRINGHALCGCSTVTACQVCLHSLSKYVLWTFFLILINFYLAQLLRGHFDWKNYSNDIITWFLQFSRREHLLGHAKTFRYQVQVQWPTLPGAIMVMFSFLLDQLHLSILQIVRFFSCFTSCLLQLCCNFDEY